MTNRTSNAADWGLSVEAASGEAASQDREFLLSLGIEPYDLASIGRPASPDLTTTLINSLAIVQFAALLIGLVWMWLHLE